VTSGLSATEWEAFLAGHPQAHILQTAAWGELKASFGWEVMRLREGDCGAQVLFRPLPLGRAVAYVPKGPLGAWNPALLADLDEACRQRRAILLKVEPDGDPTPEAGRLLEALGFRPSRQTVQPRSTIIVDLVGDEETLLARMHQKTRYNIGLAARKGVTVRAWDDVASFAAMMKTTASRNRFGAHVPEYYHRAYDLFQPAGLCELLVAEGRPTSCSGRRCAGPGERAALNTICGGSPTPKSRIWRPSFPGARAGFGASTVSSGASGAAWFAAWEPGTAPTIRSSTRSTAGSPPP